MSELKDILAPALKNFSLAQIARQAGLHPNQMSNLTSGRRVASPKTINKIRVAISRLELKQTDGALLITGLYRATLAVCCTTLGLDPGTVQYSDPRAKQASNKQWREASFARWLAQYLLNTGLGIRQAEVARGAGVTKQAVSLAVAEIELKRDDPAFDALVQRMEFILLSPHA